MGTPRDHSDKSDWVPAPQTKDGMRSDSGADKFGDLEKRSPASGLRNNTQTQRMVRSPSKKS